jgi:hypothetical protein
MAYEISKGLTSEMCNDDFSAIQVTYDRTEKWIEKYVKEHNLAKHSFGETKENHESAEFDADSQYAEWEVLIVISFEEREDV